MYTVSTVSDVSGVPVSYERLVLPFGAAGAVQHLIVSLKPDGPINTKELFVQTVCAGRPAKGMPAWCALGLDMGKINDIYLYVKGRSDAKLSPGRPAVKAGG